MERSPTPPRRYGEKEVGKILKRATELQRDLPGGAVGSGLSLAELEEIALEAGIDPRHLRRAALELEEGELGPGGWDRVVGDQLTLVREAAVPGELDEEGFEGVVAAVQVNAGDQGQPSLLGRTLTWQAETPSQSRTLQLVVTSRDGETRVRIEERLHQFAGGLFGGTVAGGGIGLGLGVGAPVAKFLGSVLVGVSVPLATLTLSYVAAREIYRAYVRGRRRALDRLLAAVVHEVERSVRPALSPGPSEPAPPTRHRSDTNG